MAGRKERELKNFMAEHPISEGIINEIARTPEGVQKLKKIAIGLVIAAVVMQVIFMPLGVLLMLLAFVCLMSLWSANLTMSVKRKNLLSGLREQDAQGRLHELWKDYQGAGEILGMKMGREYIVSMTSGAIIRYCDIRNVYQYIHKTFFIEDSRSLQAVTTKNKTFTLTGLARKGKSDAELQKIVAFMLIKNPSITVGFFRK